MKKGNLGQREWHGQKHGGGKSPGVLRVVPWVELWVHEKRGWGGSQKGTINWVLMGGLEWHTRKWGTLPMAISGYQSLSKYSLTLGELQGLQELQEIKTVPIQN